VSGLVRNHNLVCADRVTDVSWLPQRGATLTHAASGSLSFLSYPTQLRQHQQQPFLKRTTSAETGRAAATMNFTDCSKILLFVAVGLYVHYHLRGTTVPILPPGPGSPTTPPQPVEQDSAHLEASEQSQTSNDSPYAAETARDTVSSEDHTGGTHDPDGVDNAVQPNVSLAAPSEATCAPSVLLDEHRQSFAGPSHDPSAITHHVISNGRPSDETLSAGTCTVTGKAQCEIIPEQQIMAEALWSIFMRG
jgi:hypothetical protein